MRHGVIKPGKRSIEWCIVKKSRHRREPLRSLPYDMSGHETLTEYDILRAAIYDTYDEALIACQNASLYNPVGFVPQEICKPKKMPFILRRIKSAIPRRGK